MITQLDKPTSEMLDFYISKLKNLMEDDLIGVYIYGSLALDAYNPERSVKYTF